MRTHRAAAIAALSDERRAAMKLLGKWMPEPNTGCWLWLGATTAFGYGSLNWKGTGTIKAHRASWLAFRGSLPSGAHVLHRCDTPACVNPEHLFIGTHSDNMRDMTAKGRGRIPCGVKHRSAVLTPDAVREIRRLAGTTSASALGCRFGVNRTTVDRVVSRRTWKQVTDNARAQEGEP